MRHFTCTTIVKKQMTLTQNSVSAEFPGRHFVSFLESEDDSDTWHKAIVTAAISFFSLEREEDADTWHKTIVTAAILFLFSRKRGGCRHVARGHCDGRHFVSFL
jgi:hypothetical protein